MKRLSTKLTSLAVTLALVALPLAGCGGSASTDTGEAETPAATQGAAIDPSSWTTLRDALSVADSNDISYSYDENYFVCVFHSGDAIIRAVGTYQPSIEGAFADLDMGADDYREQVTEVVGDLELIEAEDITSDLMSQEELAQYVGKTGQELVDAGLVFASYNMYGGEQTAADMDKGYFSYDITFDVQVSEDQTEDGGAALMSATVVDAQSLGNLSGAALDPAAVQ